MQDPEATGEPPADEPAEQRAELPCDAIVFVPGMVSTWSPNSLRELADDVASALDRNSARLEFTVKPAEAFAYGRGEQRRTAPRVTIFRAPMNAQDVPPVRVLDLYSLEYQNELKSDLERTSLLGRAVRLLLALILGGQRIYRVLRPARRPAVDGDALESPPGGHPPPAPQGSDTSRSGAAKTGAERAQIGLALLILALYAAFLVLVLVAIVDVFFQYLELAIQNTSGAASSAVPASPTPTGAGVQPGRPTPVASQAAWPLNIVVDAWWWLWGAVEAFWTGFLTKAARFVTVIGTLIWLWLPPKHRFKEFVTNGGTEFLTMDNYLREGHGAATVGGELGALFDGLRDQGPEYRRIHLFSYSFGSIISINALFRSGEPLLRDEALAHGDSLVTIGCPFDMVRLVRPTYFMDRERPEGSTEEDPIPRRWINVYAPTDILGSNFRNDAKTDDASLDVMNTATGGQLPRPTNQLFTPGGGPQEGNLFNTLFLNGFKAHGMYWNPAIRDEDTCFRQLIGELYRGDPILQA